LNWFSQLRHPDRLFAVVVIVASAIMYVLTGTMIPPDAPGAISAAAYPKFILIVIVLLSCLVCIRPVQGMTRRDPIRLRGIPIVLLSILYIALIEPVGYFLVTPVFLFVLPLLAGFRNHLLNAVSAVIVTALIYGVFVKTLSIPLPPGLLGD